MIDNFKKIIPHFLKKFIINQVDKNYRFKGWNLKTKNCPPWTYINQYNSTDPVIPYFTEMQNEFENLVNKKKFVSHQFNEKLLVKSKELMWRHYNLCLSLQYVLKKKKNNNISLCEVGVADGITAWFTLNFFKQEKEENYKLWLYDSWEEMKKEYLDSSEQKKIGKFNNNNMETTKNNLIAFNNIRYIKGYIPNVFTDQKNFPERCDWLHIDLNSSNATLDTLEFFEKKLNNGGLILFDDFGWPSYETTRIKVEKWCKKNNGILWPLTTAQAIFFIDKS